MAYVFLFDDAVTRVEYQLIDVTEEGYASVLDPLTGDMKDDLTFPPDSVLDDAAEVAKYHTLLETMRGGEKDVIVVVLSALGQSMILSQASASTS